MSFFGNFAEHAARMSASLHPVLEITLNNAAWDGTTEMFLSSSSVDARGNSYDPRIPEAGWQSITRKIDLRAAGLESVGTTVTVIDTDGKVRAALQSGDQRNSAAAIWRVIPGSATDYASLFTGLLDSWTYQQGQVQLHLKTDERALRSYFPQWPYLDSEWFWMAQDSVGTYAPIAYGKHDSTNLGLDHGLVPTVRVWLDATSAWYATNIGPADLIKDVYVRSGDVTTQQTNTQYNKVYGSLAGGKIFTIIEFTSGNFPAEDDVVSVDLYGYAWQGGGPSGMYNGDGTITNPVEQVRHFLVNFAINRTRGYVPGGWDADDPLIDDASWDVAATWALTHGLEGARYLQDQTTALETFREWLESFPLYRAFWNADGKIELITIGTDWPGYWDGSSALLRSEDELGKTFEWSTDAGDITGKISAKYLYDSFDGKFLRSLDVQDISSDVLSDLKYELYWSPARQI